MFGNALLNLMGQQDPRQRLLASATGRGAVPGTTPAAGGGAPGSVPPAAPAQPAGTTTAPDLLELYTALNDRSRKENAIDRGVTLIAAGLSDPAYKQNILNSMPSGQTDNSDLMNLVMTVNEQQRAIAEKAAQVQAGIKAGVEAGLDENTAKYLADTGQLGNILSTKMAAENKGARTQIIGDAATGYHLADLDTGKTIPVLAAQPKPGWTQLSPEEITAKGLDPNKDWQRSPEGKIEDIGSGGVTVNNNLGGNNLPDMDQDLIGLVDKDLVENGTPAAKSALNTISSIQTAKSIFDQGIITGSALSPYEFEGRKALASVFGIDDAAVNNTAAFQSVLGDVVMGKISALGTGNAISNADLLFTKEAVGTGGTVPAEAVPRILRTIEIGTYNQILQHNKAVDAQIAARGEDIDPRVRATLEAQKVPVPEISIPSDAIAALKEAYSAAPTPEAKRAILEEFGRDSGMGIGTAESLVKVL